MLLLPSSSPLLLLWFLLLPLLLPLLLLPLPLPLPLLLLEIAVVAVMDIGCHRLRGRCRWWCRRNAQDVAPAI